MAVRHGYGKVAGADALVFAYDTGDTRNSYKGRPTTNLATLDLGNWINEGGVRTLLDQTYLGNPVYRWRSNPGQIWISPFAWNSNFDLTSNDMTVSAYFYNESGNTETVGMYFGKDFSTDDAGNPNYRSIPVDGKWHKHSWTMYANAGYANYLEFRTSSDTMLITTPMVEYGRIASQPVEGTRSTTQGLLDLAGNSSIDLSNVSFDSNAQMTFDATDDYINLNSVAPLIAGGDFSLEAVIKGPTQDHKGIIPINTSTGGNRALFLIRHASMGLYDGGTWYIGNIDVDDNNWHHVMLSYTRSTKKAVIYVDGEISLDTTTNNMITVATDDRISVGQEWDGASTSDHFNGDIPVVKIYNKALTTTEVRNNYNNYKGRFDI
jgi:hypothetical protein